ncbi:Uncharacterised protein [uncultured archaeon]|nr:Uncharacterised protein [uncultured archaeon]
MSNPCLKFAVETLLKEANPNGGPYFRTTHFHKMMFLLYKQLKKKNLDIKLPYSWYHYGPFMDGTEFERQVGVPISYYAPDEGPTRAIDCISYEGIPSKNARLVERESRSLVKRYKENDRYKFDYLNILLDNAYAFAPFEFQKVFNRGFILILKQFKSYDVSEEEVELYLDKLIKIFPYTEMHEVYDTFLEWNDTIHLALNYKNPSYIAVLAEKFWLIYSELLHIKKNENISDDIIELWSINFPEKLDEYLAGQEQERRRLLQMRRRDRVPNEETQKIVVKLNDLAYNLAAKK